MTTTTFVQQYEAIWRMIQFCGAYCGANVTKEGYRMTPLTWFLLIAVKIFFALTAYTVYVCIVIDNDWVAMLQSLCILGNGIQGYVKLIINIYYKDIQRDLFEEIHEIYIEYEKKGSAYKSCLKESIRTVSNAIKLVALIYLFAVFYILACPVYNYFVKGQRILVLQFYFPYIDHRMKRGYVYLTAMHVMCVGFASFGNFAGDMHIFCPIGHVTLMKNILVCKFHDLNELLLEQNIDGRKTNEALIDILKWHQKYTSYIERTKLSSFWVLAAIIFTTTLSIILSVFCIMVGGWPGAYGYVIACFCLLYIFCGLGALVDVSNDGFIEACYTEVLWYLLSPSEQKMMQLMLLMTQNASGLTVAGVAPLNMNTALQVTKAIYTFTMMLFSFLE